MDFERIAGFLALGWLIGAVLLMGRLIRRGRGIAATFAARHPEAYRASGRPLPGYFYSARRSRFARFLACREFEGLGDPDLAARFEQYRKAEGRLLLVLLGSLLVVVLLIAAVRWVA